MTDLFKEAVRKDEEEQSEQKKSLFKNNENNTGAYVNPRNKKALDKVNDLLK